MESNLVGEHIGHVEDAEQMVVSLSECLERHFHRILLMVASHTGAKLARRVSIEDLAQEVVVEALKRRDAFEYQGEARFIRWISTLAHRVVCNLARVHDRTPATSSIGYDTAGKWDVRPSRIPGPTHTPSSIAAHSERCRHVQAGLASLREQDRTVIRMVQLEDRPLAEVAAATDCSKEAVAKRLVRGLERLGDKLADCDHEHHR